MPPAESRRILSAQNSPHRDLVGIVRRHADSIWQRPVARHTREAFADSRSFVESSRPLVLDSCCGTGESTRRLAARYPEANVLGIDKSEDRLSRHQQGDENNYRLVRADVNDFWRLLAEYRISLSRHCLFYPNPYPKSSQLRKRWHGSPAFPVLVGLGGQLEVRSNWLVYIEEFALALGTFGKASAVSEIGETDPPISLFEKKYREGGQTLYALTADLRQSPDG